MSAVGQYQWQVPTVAQVAHILGCTERTVEDHARAGRLPGLKFGTSWVFPMGALVTRLDEWALEEAALRRKSSGYGPEGGPMTLVTRTSLGEAQKRVMM